MKKGIVVFTYLCFFIKSLLGYPVFDEQKGYLTENMFSKIDYRNLIDYDFFVNLTTKGMEHRAVFIQLQDLSVNMEDSILKFISCVQNEARSLKNFEKQTIKLDGKIKDILGKNEISLASAIWLYHIVFLTKTELSNMSKDTLKIIQKSYDDYLESLSEESF